MCGIIGVLGGGGSLHGRVDYALSLLAHRGPDGSGVWRDDQVSLGHRRLAIIDLRHDADQPMVDSESGVTIIFNGEIYNYREVRAELESLGVAFRTASDTEVLLKAYLVWGKDLFTRLNGMFAFAIYEPRDRRLLLARDRFGVKPLYYALINGTLMFASEPKALLALDPSLAEPDEASVHDFVVHSRSFTGPRSYYKSIRCLQAAHCAVYSLGDRALREVRYWSCPEYEGGDQAPEEAIEEFSEIFDSAVRLRLRADVPVGLTLSGGIDSSAVLAGTVGQPLEDLKCFTSVYSGHRGEEHWAAKAATLAERTLTAVPAETSDWYGTLQTIAWHMDAPGSSPAVFPLWSIMRTARKSGVPVLLEGQGADELLAGYLRFAPYETKRLLGASLTGGGPLTALSAHIRGTVATFGMKAVVMWHLRHAAGSLYSDYQAHFGRRNLLLPEVSNPNQPLSEILTQNRSPFYRALMYDYTSGTLPALLHYGDAISMAHGIESRAPFMDYRLAEWVFRRHPILLHTGKTKWPVRGYLEKMGFGEMARRRDKKAYPTPVREWIVHEAPRIVDQMISNGNAPIWSYLERNRVRRLFETVVENGGQQNAFHLYKILTLHVWLEQVARVRSTSLSVAIQKANWAPQIVATGGGAG